MSVEAQANLSGNAAARDDAVVLARNLKQGGHAAVLECRRRRVARFVRNVLGDPRNLPLEAQRASLRPAYVYPSVS
jgi:hypothetical protein